MSNWFISACAFILLMVSISAFTMHVFLQSTAEGFDGAKTIASQRTDALVNETFAAAYAQIPASQKTQIAQLEQIPPEQRSLVLAPVCSSSKSKGQPFCDTRFISGTTTFETIMRGEIKKELDIAAEKSLSQLNDTLQSYARFDLFLISLVAATLSVLLYFLGNGIRGLQSFFGNATWLSVLSALSFKIMPSIIDKLVSSIPMTADEMTKKAASVILGVVVSWLKPAMHNAFVVSVWLAVSACVLWLLIKVTRNYVISVD